MLPPILVELKASSSEFMAKMGEARAEIGKLGNEGSAHLAKVSEVGKAAFLGLGGAAVLGAVASVHSAMHFQESMTTLVTGAGEAESNIKLVSNGLLKMAGEVGISAQQLAKGMYLVESAGYHGAEGLKVMHAAAEGARVGGASMTAVADGLTTALKDYRIPADQAAEVTSKLVATVARGKTHMEDLSSSLATVLPASSAAGVGLNQVLGAMATLTSVGTPAAKAATYLRQTILMLANPTAGAAHEMQALGLSAIDISTHLGSRGLTGTFDILTKAITDKMGPGGIVLIETLRKASAHTSTFQKVLADLPPTQQTYIAALAKMVGGTKSMQAALELTGANAKDFAGNVKAIGSTTTEAGGHVQGFALTQKDLKTQLENAKAAVEAISISVGLKLIPIIQSATKFLLDHKDVVASVAVAIGVVLVGAMVVWLAQLAIAAAEGVVSFVTMIGKALVWAATTTGAITEVEAAWAVENAGMLAAAATSVIAMGAMLVPFLPIIAACALLAFAAYELYKHWDTVWRLMKEALHAAWEFISKTFTAIVGFIRSHIAIIVGVLFLLFPAFTLVLASLHFLYEHWQTIWDAIKAVVSAVWGFLRPIFAAIVTVGLDVIKTALSALGDVWHTVWGALHTAVEAAWGVIKPILDEIGKAVGGVASAIGDLGKAAGAVGSVVGKVTGGIGSALGFGGGKAVGGDVSAGMTYLVGERGPELITMGGKGYVTPNDQLGKGGGSTVTYAPSITVNGGADPEHVADLVAAHSQEQFDALVRELRSGRR